MNYNDVACTKKKKKTTKGKRVTVDFLRHDLINFIDIIPILTL